MLLLFQFLHDYHSHFPAGAGSTVDPHSLARGAHDDGRPTGAPNQRSKTWAARSQKKLMYDCAQYDHCHRTHALRHQHKLGQHSQEPQMTQ